jgi:peptidoglycan L-alanyl-D-glutamate endopeptidase CwlK
MRAATVRAAELGITVKLIDGTRSYKEQDKLFRKRPKVTNARGGQSWHNFGLAFDFGLFRGKEYLGESPHYKTLGAIASTMPGLTWGGTWVNLVDEPHIQLNLFDTVAKARAAFEA